MEASVLLQKREGWMVLGSVWDSQILMYQEKVSLGGDLRGGVVQGAVCCGAQVDHAGGAQQLALEHRARPAIRQLTQPGTTGAGTLCDGACAGGGPPHLRLPLLQLCKPAHSLLVTCCRTNVG